MVKTVKTVKTVKLAIKIKTVKKDHEPLKVHQELNLLLIRPSSSCVKIGTENQDKVVTTVKAHPRNHPCILNMANVRSTALRKETLRKSTAAAAVVVVVVVVTLM